jgi:hypothetical protein
MQAAKQVAIKEIEKRIVTKEQAKEDFKKWIRSTVAFGGFNEKTLKFWKDVINESEKL